MLGEEEWLLCILFILANEVRIGITLYNKTRHINRFIDRKFNVSVFNPCGAALYLSGSSDAFYALSPACQRRHATNKQFAGPPDCSLIDNFPSFADAVNNSLVTL